MTMGSSLFFTCQAAGGLATRACERSEFPFLLRADELCYIHHTSKYADVRQLVYIQLKFCDPIGIPHPDLTLTVE